MSDLNYQSSVEGVVWPAFPGRVAAATLAVHHQLLASEWMSPAQIEAAQFRQLGHLLAHCQRHVPYYRDRDAYRTPVAGIVTSESWSQLPVLTRTDVQSAGTALHALQMPAGHGKNETITTSGSTGEPVEAIRTGLWGLIWSAMTLRELLWHRRDLSATMALIRESKAGKCEYPHGAQADNWAGSLRSVVSTGPSHSLNINTPIDQQVQWLERAAPAYFLSHPTNIERLARHSLEVGTRLPSLRLISTIAESLHPDQRQLCRDAWGVEIADIYSTREVGYLALQCPDHEHYHVQSEATALEILREDGSRCGPGEVGRVVATSLHNFAIPLLRYDIGDYAEVGETCECGRGLPVVKRIMGRVQQILKLPTGEQRWPLLSAGDVESLVALAPIRQYQFLQRSLEVIEVRLVVDRTLRADEEAAITAWVQKKFAYPFEIVLEYRSQLPRSAAGKHHTFMSEVD